jgi:hypothetical protein
MKTYLILVVAILSGCGILNKDPDIVLIETTYSFHFGSKKTQKIEFWVSLPSTLNNRQELLRESFSLKPEEIKEIGGERIAKFMYVLPSSNAKLVIKSEMKIPPNNAFTGLSASESEIKDSLFLKAEPYIEYQDSAFQVYFKELQKEDSSLLIKEIPLYVKQTLNYAGFIEKDLGVLGALAQKKGDCTEFADLSAGLCRASGRPAKVLSGYLINNTEIYFHSWVECLDSNNLWQRLDATISAMNLQPDSLRYVQLSDRRHSEALDGKRIVAYKYWGAPFRLSSNARVIPQDSL